MREVKFRGKRVDNGKWVYGLLSTDINETKYYIDSIIGTHQYCFEVIPESVGQFTGLKDKEGNDIYEGDILFVDRIGDYYKIQEHNVIWNNDFATFATSEDSTFDWVRYEGKFEVTGNIHDNPELL